MNESYVPSTGRRHRTRRDWEIVNGNWNKKVKKKQTKTSTLSVRKFLGGVNFDGTRTVWRGNKSKHTNKTVSIPINATKHMDMVRVCLYFVFWGGWREISPGKWVGN